MGLVGLISQPFSTIFSVNSFQVILFLIIDMDLKFSTIFQSFYFLSVSTCRAFSVSGKVKPEEAVQATLSSLPDEVVDTVGVTALPSEDSVSERRRKLEFLEMQEELIKVICFTSFHVSRTTKLRGK